MAESTERTKSTEKKHLRVITHKGDLFDAPENAVLVHACNTQGSWGAGIAAEFRKRYPEAYKKYRDWCAARPVAGTCFLIPPCEKEGPKHWIGCLFTSKGFGKKKDTKSAIVKNTGPAVKQLLQQILEQTTKGEQITGVRMCKINAGLFRVPWIETMGELQKIELQEGWMDEVEVWLFD
ncbi:hypothetical protein EJ04DRAFT_467989 [Polyplosphaeria fusca]|uniref:ADP-ribose 1''-phosphate phosphatase n=1 Tax=Polyplosphaeria fusca TaxID=682080 RepID=A0A9P4QYR0_9PLEO|nr:hypothetical protein EJ04DRAFT_467989 [Polyplosphaeria fusca]